MKNLSTGNYTGLRDVADGFNLRPKKSSRGKLGEHNMTILGFVNDSKNKIGGKI